MDATRPAARPAAWCIDDAHAEHGRFKDYRKKHPRETAKCEDNLRRVLAQLQATDSPEAFRFNFFRHESGQVWRIGQTGLAGAKETRLYVYLFLFGRTIYKLSIGGKERQRQDIARCVELAETIRKQAEGTAK